MAAEGGQRGDFYAILGLKKECSASELRNAYKKLALRWHPDRCSASGNSKFVEDAKKKFQAIQEAYSVLSDANKRFLYDVGVYESDDDENGMGDFLDEMASLMTQTEITENGGGESFEELQELFVEMFQRDMEEFPNSSQQHQSHIYSGVAPSSSSSSSSFVSNGHFNAASNKRNSSEMIHPADSKLESCSTFDAHFSTFCLGAGHRWGDYSGREAKGGMPRVASGISSSSSSSRRRHGRKQKVSSTHDVSANDH